MTSRKRPRELWFHLVRWAFRQLYGPFAWAYDAVAWAVSRGEWRRWGRAALPWVTGERVLELGCGPGHLLVGLAAWRRTPVGLDASPAMLRLARANLVRRGLPVRLVQARAQALPFAGEAFDAVVVAFPTDFISHPATLAEVHRVLAPGGRLVLVDGGRHLGRDPWSRLLNWALDVTSRPGKLEEVIRDLDRHAPQGPLFTVTRGHVRGTRTMVRVIVGSKPEAATWQPSESQV